MSTPRRYRRYVSEAVLALALLLALAPLTPAASAEEAPAWHFEKVLPPMQPGESEEQHRSHFPIGLGKIGDIEFWAPNRGLLITAGNPPTIPPGLWAYNGREWHQLTGEGPTGEGVCGATDGRIAWAGPDEFWTVSDGRVGQSETEGRAVPREDNTLCHFSGGQVVGSYASLAFRADSYQPMHAAGCLAPSDCWFGGELLPTAEAGARAQFGAFQLHWNGSSVVTEAYPAEHAIEDMRRFGSYLFESVRVKQEQRLEGESPSETPDLHLITPIGVQPTFVTLNPGVPKYAPEERPAALDFLHLSANERSLWGAANPAPPPPGSAAGQVTVVRYSTENPLGPEWSQVIGFGSPGTNPFTQPGRSEQENETVSSIAAEPETANAWFALTSPANEAAARAGLGSAMVARVSASGEVSERQALPAAGEGVGPKGIADKMVCPAHNDCWLVTKEGWLFHYSDEAHRHLAVDTDPAFSQLITFRPLDAGIPQVVPDSLPIDNSGQLGELPVASTALPESATASEARIPVALLSDIRTRLVRGTTLELRFHLAAKARVKLVARRHKSVVASTPMRTFAAGDRKLLLLLNRRRWPTKLDLQSHALAPLPTVSTRAASTTTVGTGVVALPKVPSFAQAGRLP